MGKFKTAFRSIKWCLKNDKDCDKYRLFHGDLEIKYLSYATRKNYVHVKYVDGSYDDLISYTTIQVNRK
jgi:hypothetical protein